MLDNNPLARSILACHCKSEPAPSGAICNRDTICMAEPMPCAAMVMAAAVGGSRSASEMVSFNVPRRKEKPGLTTHFSVRSSVLSADTRLGMFSESVSRSVTTANNRSGAAANRSSPPNSPAGCVIERLDRQDSFFGRRGLFGARRLRLGLGAFFLAGRRQRLGQHDVDLFANHLAGLRAVAHRQA